MRIAVFSDTHDRFPPSLPHQLSGADEIWHLGDVCDPLVLSEFEALGRPLTVVRGNCDEHPWPEAATLTREGVTFLLTHIPPTDVAPEIKAVLHGHTHRPRDEKLRGVRWLNPGCITRPNRGYPPSFAWLTVKAEKIVSWEFVRI
jgi:putative phosphoesterase